MFPFLFATAGASTFTPEVRGLLRLAAIPRDCCVIISESFPLFCRNHPFRDVNDDVSSIQMALQLGMGLKNGNKHTTTGNSEKMEQRSQSRN